MTVLDTVNRIFREFKRYTGDGLPGEPTGAALPVGDPQSGVHSPKKSELRSAFIEILDAASGDADAAAETLAEFERLYLGAKVSDPATDNEGGVLEPGALYFNTTDGKFRVWNGASWQDQSTALSDGDVTDPKLADSLSLVLDRVVSSRTELAALDVDRHAAARLREGLRSGAFEVVLLSSLSATEQTRATSDDASQQGVYVISTADPTYVWRRVYDTGYVLAEWFGATNFTFGGAQDSTVAFQAAADFADIGGAWRWKGLHRLTGSVTTHDRQKVGSFSGGIVVLSAIVSSQTAFTGVNTGSSPEWLEGGTIFADCAPGVPFFIGGASAEFHDFCAYGLGPVAVDGTENLFAPNKTAAAWNDSRGIQYYKHINLTNVGLSLFKYPLQSVGSGATQGNYYSKIDRLFVNACYTIFRVDTTDSYNTEVRDSRMSAAKFGEFSVPVRNFKVFGGSFEAFSDATILRGVSEISFFGTYMETTTQNSMRAMFTLFSTARVMASFYGCLIYLNNYRGVVEASSSQPGPCTVVSSGNRFVLGADASDSWDGTHVIYDLGGSTLKGGHLISDVALKNPSNTRPLSYHLNPSTDFNPYTALAVVSV